MCTSTRAVRQWSAWSKHRGRIARNRRNNPLHSTCPCTGARGAARDAVPVAYLRKSFRTTNCIESLNSMANVYLF